ncbi:hypothetical protein HUS23_02705 [Ectothiorhodospiraceae bacterium 2226]|nr:hypothetical protein HUS23_02705 [Ectothiorhodospiraceae bacterium 2226]
MNNLFQRQQYSAAGALVTFEPWVTDPETKERIYSVAPGETFMWIWRDVDSGQPLAFNSVSYLGGEALCWSDGSCGPSVSWWSALVLQCMEEHDRVRVEVYHDGAFLGADTLRPTRFVPRLTTTEMASAIEPKRTRLREGETTEVTVVVTDDLGCSRPIAGARVRVSATIAKSETNAQPYLTKNDIGTGEFSSLGFDAVVNPDEPTQAGTVIEGVTDWQGRFKTRYQAQAHAAEESFAFEVTRPASGTDPKLVGQPVERQLRIAVPDLVRITHDNAPLAFADAGSCRHADYPHWLTINTRSRVMTLAAIYHNETGRLLSLNDGSLPLGGVIARARVTPEHESIPQIPNHGTPRCHGSHRQGIDIDFNDDDRLVGTPGKEPVGLSMTATPSGSGDGTVLDRLDVVTSWLEGTRIPSAGIHYRFPN